MGSCDSTHEVNFKILVFLFFNVRLEVNSYKNHQNYWDEMPLIEKKQNKGAKMYI